MSRTYGETVYPATRRRRVLPAFEHISRVADTQPVSFRQYARHVSNVAAKPEHIGLAVGERHHHHFHMPVLDARDADAHGQFAFLDEHAAVIEVHQVLFLRIGDVVVAGATPPGLRDGIGRNFLGRDRDSVAQQCKFALAHLSELARWKWERYGLEAEPIEFNANPARTP